MTNAQHKYLSEEAHTQNKFPFGPEDRRKQMASLPLSFEQCFNPIAYGSLGTEHYFLSGGGGVTFFVKKLSASYNWLKKFSASRL